MIQHIACCLQHTYFSMNQQQFSNQTHLNSIDFSAEGLTPRADNLWDNLWNGQTQTPTRGENDAAGNVPAQYDQSFRQHDENTLYNFGTF
jgi:hypothetical protein